MASLLNRAKEAMTGHQAGSSGSAQALPPSLQNYFTAINSHDVAGLNMALAENVRGYGFRPNGEVLSGKQAFIDAEIRLQKLLPDVHITVDYAFSTSLGDSTWISIRQTLTGTNPVSKRSVKNCNAQAQVRIDTQTGLISEFFLATNHLSMFQQLGLVPEHITMAPLMGACTQCSQTGAVSSTATCAHNTGGLQQL